MPEAIRFCVPGNPVPQPRARISTRGGFGRAYVPREHPVHAYRLHVALLAKAAGAKPHDGDVVLSIAAVFARPKSHAKLKPQPTRPCKSDWDNVGKAVSDALQGIAYHDDDQIVEAHVTRRYALPGEVAHTAVVVGGT